MVNKISISLVVAIRAVAIGVGGSDSGGRLGGARNDRPSNRTRPIALKK